MGAIARLREALRWLGRNVTRAMAVSVAVGLAIQPLAALLKPALTSAVFVLMVLAFLRIEPRALSAVFVRPWAVALASLWIMVLTPLALCLAFRWFGASGGILLGLVLQAAAPPVLSATTFSAILGLDAALSLATLIVTTAMTPLTVPLFVAAFSGADVTLDPIALAFRLAAFLGGTFVVAVVLRRLIGAERVAGASGEIDGMSVIMLIFFGIAIMDGVTGRFLSEPGIVLALTALSFVLALGLYALTTLAFRPLGIERALGLGFSGAHRNIAIMLAAGGALPETTWLYFAVAQFPIYLVPLMITPFVHRIISQRLPGP